MRIRNKRVCVCVYVVCVYMIIVIANGSSEIDRRYTSIGLDRINVSPSPLHPPLLIFINYFPHFQQWHNNPPINNRRQMIDDPFLIPIFFLFSSNPDRSETRPLEYLRFSLDGVVIQIFIGSEEELCSIIVNRMSGMCIYICVSRNKATAEPFLPSFLPSLFSLYFIHYVITLNANTLKNALALFAWKI